MSTAASRLVRSSSLCGDLSSARSSGVVSRGFLRRGRSWGGMGEWCMVWSIGVVSNGDQVEFRYGSMVLGVEIDCFHLWIGAFDALYYSTPLLISSN